MRKDYDNPLDQMKAISWQLKRIADLMEIRLEKEFPSKQHPDVDSTKLKQFLDRLEG